jgi:hypothetical protein
MIGRRRDFRRAWASTGASQAAAIIKGMGHEIASTEEARRMLEV